jgi:hypothetical protein
MEILLAVLGSGDRGQWREGRSSSSLRASPRVCQNLLGKSCVLPTSKKLCKVKKEFISNSLA